jgi:hypothetical protein
LSRFSEGYAPRWLIVIQSAHMPRSSAELSTMCIVPIVASRETALGGLLETVKHLKHFVSGEFEHVDLQARGSLGRCRAL